MFKRSDIFTIILVSGIGIIISVFVVNLMLGNVDEKSMTIKNVDVISSDVPMPEPDVFNADAINPTVEVFVGDCLDSDGNGVLDTSELIACGRMENPISSDQDQNQNQNQDQEDSNQEDEDS